LHGSQRLVPSRNQIARNDGSAAKRFELMSSIRMASWHTDRQSPSGSCLSANKKGEVRSSAYGIVGEEDEKVSLPR
jgi:hypothetical protein